MKLAYDLHIHSCLSPCAEEEMTPHNIVHMAHLKELDIIAVADHNSAKNLPAVQTLCNELGILLLPAIEVQSIEEVHLLCYFETVEQALVLSDEIYESLPDIPIRKEIFGSQIVMDEKDTILGSLEKLLVSSVPWTIDQIYQKTSMLGGICVPAHINRQANSLLNILGFIPEKPAFTAMELAHHMQPVKQDLSAYWILQSSDAHSLGDISEREQYLCLKQKTSSSILQKLDTKKEKDK